MCSSLNLQLVHLLACSLKVHQASVRYTSQAPQARAVECSSGHGTVATGSILAKVEVTYSDTVSGPELCSEFYGSLRLALLSCSHVAVGNLGRWHPHFCLSWPNSRQLFPGAESNLPMVKAILDWLRSEFAGIYSAHCLAGFPPYPQPRHQWVVNPMKTEGIKCTRADAAPVIFKKVWGGSVVRVVFSTLPQKVHLTRM